MSTQNAKIICDISEKRFCVDRTQNPPLSLIIILSTLITDKIIVITDKIIVITNKIIVITNKIIVITDKRKDITLLCVYQ